MIRRNWYVPLSLAAVSGLGLFLMSPRGRRSLRWLAENWRVAPGRLLEWNEAAQHELDRIQTALNRVAATLESAR